MSICQINFFSESLMRTVNFSAIIPIDKRSVDGERLRDKNKPLKTLYLLHGIYGNESDWIANSRIKRLAQKLNLAVIMPAGENKFYSDQRAHDLFGRYIGEELPEFTRTMFNLSEDREDTYIAGLSMGGAGAIYAGLRYPETFGFVGAFSSGLVIDNYPPDDNSYRLPEQRSYFEDVFGPEAAVCGSDRDYRALAKAVQAAGKPMPKIYMSCGTEDGLLKVNREYHSFLQEMGWPVTYEEGPGAHDWDFWDLYIEKFLATLPLEAPSDGLDSGHIG